MKRCCNRVCTDGSRLVRCSLCDWTLRRQNIIGALFDLSLNQESIVVSIARIDLAKLELVIRIGFASTQSSIFRSLCIHAAKITQLLTCLNVRVPRRNVNLRIALTGRNAQERIQNPRLLDFLSIVICHRGSDTLRNGASGSRININSIRRIALDFPSRTDFRIEIVRTGKGPLNNIADKELTIINLGLLELNIGSH